MSQIERLRALAEQRGLYDPPIGVYVVTREGDFVNCNDRVREILQIPVNSPLPKSIKDFYFDPEEREKLLEKMEAGLHINSDQWMAEVIRLRVNEREKFINDFSRAIFDPETQEVLGFLCCMIDVTEEELYNRLLKSLPVGLYQLDEDDTIIEINRAAIDMLGYGSKDELVNKSIMEVCADTQEEEKFNEFKQSVAQKGKEPNKVIELRKKTGESIFVSLSAFRITSSDAEYVGQEGTMVDVTTEELYRRLLNHVPVGLYVVNERSGMDIITDCNEQFAKINGYQTKDEMVGTDIKKLHASTQSYEEYIKALIECGEDPLLGYPLHVRTREGREAVFEVNSRLLFDGRGKKIGRVGAMRDISEKAKLQQKVEELTDDIGTVLHSYSSSLVKIHLSLDAVRRSLGQDPFKQGFILLPERASEELFEPANRLVKAIDKLVGMSNSDWGATALPQDKWEHLSMLADLLRDYQKNFPSLESHPPTLRKATIKILEIRNEIQKGKLSKDLTRAVTSEVMELLRICSLISIHQLLDLNIGMEYPVFALREFVTSEKRLKEERTLCKISHLISQSVNNMNDFALNRGVTFRYKISSSDAVIEVIERNIIRAFDNILHNAIKYSWQRKLGESPWISIRAHTTESHLEIEFENWGVPIPKEEIDKGLIFRTGFRGRLSSDRGRVGTGIGLADARRVVRDHDGELAVKSIPSVYGKGADNYDQPFLTTATIKLPLHAPQGAKHAEA